MLACASAPNKSTDQQINLFLKRLDIYIGRQFLATFLFASLSFLALFIVIDLIENVDRFIKNDIGPGVAAQYYLSWLPEVFLLTAPVAVLLASLYITGRLSSSNELPVIFSAGIGLKRLLLPFLTITLAISALNMVNAGWIVPHATIHKNWFGVHYLNKSYDSNFEKGNVHILESDNRILSLARVDQNSGIAENVRIETFEGSRMVERIDADSMRYSEHAGRWLLDNVRHRRFLPDTTLYTENPGTDTLELSITASSLKEYHLRPDEMNIVQHRRFIDEKQQAGFSNLQVAIIQFHSKLAQPVASLIMVLIGVPLSTRKKRSGLALEAGLSLLIGFVFLGFQKTILSVGEVEQLDPVLAAWLPNLLFLAVAILLYKTAKT
ncbi:LPS export ABC transporter permease LptG [Prosthecochloris sp. ZM_2]|nr:LPS export ABC transporter permease LptG [Prosthecochloris sp. ZM_2]